MKIRINDDGSIDTYKATFYEDEVIVLANCLNFIIGLVEEFEYKDEKLFINECDLDRVIDVANKCNRLVSQLPKE